MKRQNVSISDALFSKVRQRVLSLLYNHTDTDFHTNEIIRITKSGTGAVQRELATLASSGIISVKQVGNQKRYQANLSAPIFAELHGIVTKTFGLADQLRQALQPITMLHIAFIYGSVSKRQDTARSDIDIMLIGNNITYVDIYKLLEKIEAQLGRKINPTCYSLSEWYKKIQSDNHFIKKIMSNEKIFLIGSEDELEKLGQFGKSKQTKK